MEKRRLAEDLVRYAWQLATDTEEAHVSEALEYLDKAISYDSEHEYV